MKNKVKICIMLICISAVFCTNTFAVSKEAIIGYVNSQTVCGDTGLFNTYKSTFTRLLKQKQLTESELDTVYSYLQSAVGILNSKNVCKLADIGKLTTAERNSVYGSLTAGAGIITSAPMIEYGEEESTNTGTNNDVSDKDSTSNNENITNNAEGTKVTINTQDNTMDIYENGVLVDKVSMSTQKMTYTGVNATHVLIVVISILLFIVSLLPFVSLSKKHTAKTRFLKNILVSVMICSGIVATTVLLFGSKIDYAIGLIDLVSFSSSEEEIKVELNEDKTIKKYPSYGSNYATLKIENLGIENKVYFGDTQSILSLGIGHTTWSDMPTEGGVVVYSGHNKKEMLSELKDIQEDDQIIVDTVYAKCTYEVKKTEIVKDNDTDKLSKIEDKETLILYTCYPFDSYVYTDERFIVYSVLKEIQWK